MTLLHLLSPRFVAARGAFGRAPTKPVVLTGAQRPIAFVRTDARGNLVHSALCAAMDVPEVCVFFGRWLFRGNRTTKTSIQSYEAFESPDLAPILEMGVEIVQTTLPRYPAGPFRLVRGFEEQVAVLQIVPGSGPAMLRAAVASGARGVVLRPMAGYGLPDCLRITVGDARENRRLLAALDALQ